MTPIIDDNHTDKVMTWAMRAGAFFGSSICAFYSIVWPDWVLLVGVVAFMLFLACMLKLMSVCIYEAPMTLAENDNSA